MYVILVVGANFPQQLSSRTQLAKINNNKKNIPENQCDKHKKASSDI